MFWFYQIVFTRYLTALKSVRIDHTEQNGDDVFLSFAVGHLGRRARNQNGSTNTITICLIKTHPRNINAKFGSSSFSGFEWDAIK